MQTGIKYHANRYKIYIIVMNTTKGVKTMTVTVGKKDNGFEILVNGVARKDLGGKENFFTDLKEANLYRFLTEDAIEESEDDTSFTNYTSSGL